MDFATFQKLINDERNHTSDNLAVRFYDRSEKTGEMKDGINTYKKVCYCEIRIKDNITEVFDQPADAEKIARFPVEYSRYKLSKEQEKSGTPIDKFGFLDIDELDSCKIHGIFTIEALAELSAENVKKLNLDVQHKKALEFVEFNSKAEDMVRTAEENNKLKADVTALEEKLAKVEEEKAVLLNDLTEIQSWKAKAEEENKDASERYACLQAELESAKVKIADLEKQAGNNKSEKGNKA